MKVLLTTLNAKYIHTSLALRNLREFCRQDGIDITIAEYTINQSCQQILSDIYSHKPEVVGIACYIWNMAMVSELASLLKKVLPGTVLILGGPEVSYDPAEVLQTHPAVDYIVMGEGEEVLCELLRNLRLHRGRGIDGLAWRTQAGICVNGKPRTVSRLDQLPFAYHPAELESFKERILYYESSRGCPFSCQYCLSSATSGVRFYSLERVLADLTVFIAHDVKQVKFVDRTFNSRKEHYLPIIRFLSQQECRTNFHFEIAADWLDEEALALLAAAPPGRFQLEIGIQSTNEPTLAAICRRNDWGKINRSLSVLRQSGNMHLHLDLIVGLPYETLAIFARSFNAVYDLKPHMLQIGFLKLLKGSGVRRSGQLHDYAYTDAAPYEVLSNRYLNYAAIRKLHLFEDVFNLTYNSGRFLTACGWLIAERCGGNAFAFYFSLSHYWEQRQMHFSSHSPKGMYEFLAQFCQERFPQQLATFLELLKFDALTSDGGSVRPECLPWNYPELEAEISAFWRNDETVARYLAGYRFTSWRQIKRTYQVEAFTLDIPALLRTGRLQQQRSVLLFDYSRGGAWTLLSGIIREELSDAL